MKKTLFYIAIVMFVLSSCERQEDVDLNVPFKRKLVAAVFVGAGDSMVRASLSYTTPVFGTVPAIDPERADGAGGILFYNGVQAIFTYDSAAHEHTVYTAPHQAAAGDTYQVIFTDNRESVSGTTVVPNPVELDMRLKFDSVTGGSFQVYQAEITYTLKSSAPAYVKILPILMLDDSMSIIPMYTEVLKPMVLLHPGQSVTSRFIASASFNGWYPLNIRCLVVACDEAYAKYANATQGGDLGSIFPGSEPSLVYSNMSNQIGIIASYNICGEQVFSLK